MESDILLSTLDYIPNHIIIETKGIITHCGFSSYPDFDYLKQLAKREDCNAIINIKMFQIDIFF